MNTGLLTMAIPVGGRGKKAPYETMQMRVPVPVKPLLEKIVEEYRNNGVVPVKPNTSLGSVPPTPDVMSDIGKDQDDDDDDFYNDDSEPTDAETIKSQAEMFQKLLSEKRMLEKELEVAETEVARLKVERKKALDILGPMLKRKSNAGGAIKEAIRQAFPELPRRK